MVVFHISVLAYGKSREDRAAFARTVREIGHLGQLNGADISSKASPHAIPD